MKILVVDDVLVERANVTSIIKALGHTPIEAENGQRALDLAMEHKPAAVIMDIVMPILDGFGALKRMTGNPDLKDIPVIIVSSKGQDSDKRRGEMLGCKGWLTKPVTAAALKAVLEPLLKSE